MDSPTIYSLGAVIIVSLISLAGVFSLTLKKDELKKILLFLVSFSAGALLGDVFLHLLPEIYEQVGLEMWTSFLILGGILIFFGIEKFIKWRHCHDQDCQEHTRSFVWMNLIGDALHNFIDGILIAGSFLSSIPLGVTTTVAVILHEIPQEIGDFGVLIHGGFSTKRALFFNFLSALSAILGASLTILIGNWLSDSYLYILPLTAGGFLYIASSDLIPELHKETNLRQSAYQLGGIVLGVLFMCMLIWVE